MILKVSGIDAYYGNVQALHGVSLEVEEKEIVAVIGSNGAGKSTTMNSIMGAVPVRKGNIEFMGKDITKMKTHDITRQGIIEIPEGREVFPGMTVLENLEMGSYSIKRSRTELKNKKRAKQRAGSLSGGEQQMLAVARGLMSDPKLLMCDEPSLGLAPVIVDDMFDIFIRVNKELGIPIIIVEQNAYMALQISKRCYVLENGYVTASGDSETLSKDDTIIKAYLGG